MCDAFEASSFSKARRADCEFILMLGAAQATRQGLTPSDFDTNNGLDALTAIFTAGFPDWDRDTIFVTPEWRRVVISARRLIPRSGLAERFWRWRTTGDATAVHCMQIPTL